MQPMNTPGGDKMSRIEGPQVMAAILVLGIIAVVVTFQAPDVIDKIVGGVITGVVALGLKLLDFNGKNGNG